MVQESLPQVVHCTWETAMRLLGRSGLDLEENAPIDFYPGGALIIILRGLGVQVQEFRC